MMLTHSLEQQFAQALGRTHAVICGRGTTALWLALRAIRRRDGPGEVILPDLLCMTALEGVLLAGFTPVFADVLPGRFTLSARSVASRVTGRTRAILAAHLYGHIADLAPVRRAAPGIPIIEDAVQGFGGSLAGLPAGALGDLSFISFAETKMIAGRGGMLLFDDDSLADGIMADRDRLGEPPEIYLPPLDLLPPPAAASYADYLRTFAAPALLRPFDDSPANQSRIQASWQTLGGRVTARSAQAAWLADHLQGFPLALPELRAGDALWCYTVMAPSALLARRLIHDLNRAGLNGSGLYTPLSRIFGRVAEAGRLVNLWFEDTHSLDSLQRTLDVVAAVPWSRLVSDSSPA